MKKNKVNNKKETAKSTSKMRDIDKANLEMALKDEADD